MERDLLVRLSQHADQTLGDLRRSDPELAAAIDAVFTQQVEQAVGRVAAQASPALRAQVIRLLTTAGPFADGRALLEALRRSGPPELANEAVRLRRALDALARRFGRGHTTPLRDDPALAGELAGARLYVLGDAAGVPSAKMGRVVQAATRVTAVDDTLLTDLVANATLTEPEARALGATVTLHNMLDDQPDLAREARRQLGSADLETAAALDAATWRTLIDRAKSRPPAGMTAATYAESLVARLAAVYPTQALMGRLMPKDLSAQTDRLAGAPAADRARFSNRYPGLGILALLDDRSVPDAQKAQQVLARIALLQQVQQRNGGRNLMALDYTPDSAQVRGLDFGGMPPSDQRMVLSALKAYQRTWALARDPATTTQLLEAGYSSSTSIVNDGYVSFAKKSSLPPETAHRIYQSALKAVAGVTARVGTLIDVYKGGFQWLGVSNVGPDVDDYLKKIDGFAELFGSQATCACEHCQSLLSPAAYFVDLMCFVEKHVSKIYFTGSHAGHALHLKVRRPDLWTLELTCDNTDNEIPTLQIADEVLENYIARTRNFAGDLTDRAAVEEEVYHQAILPGPIHSFRQPFLLPLARLQTYIAYFSSSRFSVADTIGVPPAARAGARLAISQPELDLITKADSTLPSLRTLYGVHFQLLSSGEVDLLDAQTLYEGMGLSRGDLGTLAATRFVLAGAPNLQILTEKKSPASVQEDVERVHHLTLDGLDRMHRMTRLQRCLTWTVGELDLVLTQLQDATLGPPVVQTLVDLLAIQDQLAGTSVEELCALVGTIPRVPIAEDEDALFDRVFNPSFYQSSGGVLPQDATRFVHPSFRANPPAATDTMLARLLGGLRTSDEDLTRLIIALAAPLGANLQSASEDERGFFLTAANLSLLYRHARLAERLSLSIAELFQLIGLAGLTGGFVANGPAVTALLDFHTWWKSTSYTLDDLAFATGGSVATPETYPEPETLTTTIVSGVAVDKSLLFADTIFAYFAGVNEAQSRAVVAANPTLFELAPDGASYRLPSAFVPTSTLTIPAGTPLAASDAMALLLAHHASQIIPNQLAAKLSSSVDVINALITMTGADLSSGYTRVLQGLDPPAALTTLITSLLPLWVLFRGPTYDAKALAFVRAQGARFAITSFASVSMASVRKLSVYAAFAKAGDPAFTDSVTPLDPADVQAVLTAFDPTQKWAATDADQLSRVLRAETGLVSTVTGSVALPATAPEALDKLRACVALCQTLGVSGDFLALSLSEDYAKLQQAADAILAAFRAKFEDEDKWNDQVEPYDDRLRERKRDALIEYLTRTIDPAFEDGDALYHYFLIDVQVAGCARTSRVVSATSSVQVYVNRVLMNLEQDNLAPSDAGHVAVPPDAIPADEWTWRQNYRVWEANRKVFLYPESYIEPELRDDKSPIFEDLESTLLQQDINDDTVLDAYGTYLRAFDDVAGLKIAGVWHDVREDVQKDVLHVIGVALGDPPVYYYRNVENLYYGERDGETGVVWSPWTPINVQITSDKASPVVYRGRLYIFWSDVKTRSVNVVKDGSSQFGGYQHTMSIKYTMQRLDGSWTPAQSLAMPASSSGWPFGPSAGVVMDLLLDSGQDQGSPEHAYPPEVHDEARDDYTLSGYDWEALYLEPFEDQAEPALGIVGRNHQMYGWVDFYKREISAGSSLHDSDGTDFDGMPILCAKVDSSGESEQLYYGHPVSWYQNRNSYADMALDDRRIAVFKYDYPSVPLDAGLYKKELADMKEFDLLSISSATAGKDAILQRAAEVLLLRGSSLEGAHWWVSRIGTTLADRMAEKLSLDGVDELLSTAYQLSLQEDALPLSIITRIKDKSNAGKLDFAGPYGVYFREVFFHIPFLIANYLNSQGQYESAMDWYKYIFDPTAAEQTTPETDRNWRYAEFRGLKQPKLLDILTDQAAIEVYRTDPFNPHAIARLRLSAYQKCIVMKYIDNLLDWGDSLYTEFTTESINEATLLYVMAQDILGPRPVELGECSSGVTPKTYEKLSSLCGSGSEFLVDVETYQLSKRPQVGLAGDKSFVLDKNSINVRVKANTPAPPPSKDPQAVKGIFRGPVWKDASSPQWTRRPGSGKSRLQTIQVKARQTPIISNHRQLPSFGASLISQVNLAFCVPPNSDLLAYWDRVQDRLYKIRNCMDIEGVKRQPALFAPEIDPRLLVRAKAAGLSLEDVISSIGGELPPYRFLYLIEKAKQYAGSLQGYGSALLAALEKKDGEELAQLRTVHQQNLLKLTTQVRQWEIDAASKAVDALQAQIDTTTWRREQHKEYIDSGLTGWEVLQSDSRYVATGVYLTESMTSLVAAIFGLVPQTGSPFALKWGGVELHNSFSRFAYGAEAMGRMAEAISTAATMVAGFDRRKQGWQYQYDLADKELASLTRQIEAAQKRLDIANRSMEIHQTTIDQTEEIYEFFADKFSNLGLYTYLSTTLQRSFREAYTGAYAMARLCEQAYRFERGDDGAPLLEPSYWDSGHNGLLSGEQLLIDLQAMERRFLETNYRNLEIDQSLSLLQLDPAALISLRETGTCDFWVPELFFDVFYPGHYQRKIKSARLTIPAVTGPYTNVSAMLTLLESKVRTEPKLNAGLLDVPPRRSVSIATSSAQNDAGVFELSFRDERYMPFEGAGCISHWQLSLPGSFRPFDYQTINDVILSLAYTASADGVLRQQIEAQNAAIQGTLLNVLSNQSLVRVFSLRQDFASAFASFLHRPAGTAVPIEITDKFFPLFLSGRNLKVQHARLVLRTPAGQSVAGVSITLDGHAQAGFGPDAELGGLPSRDLGTVLAAGALGTHTLSVSAPGALALTSPSPGDVSAIDAIKLNDVLLYVEYRVA